RRPPGGLVWFCVQDSVQFVIDRGVVLAVPSWSVEVSGAGAVEDDDARPGAAKKGECVAAVVHGRAELHAPRIIDSPVNEQRDDLCATGVMLARAANVAQDLRVDVGRGSEEYEDDWPAAQRGQRD